MQGTTKVEPSEPPSKRRRQMQSKPIEPKTTISAREISKESTRIARDAAVVLPRPQLKQYSMFDFLDKVKKLVPQQQTENTQQPPPLPEVNVSSDEEDDSEDDALASVLNNTAELDAEEILQATEPVVIPEVKKKRSRLHLGHLKPDATPTPLVDEPTATPAVPQQVQEISNPQPTTDTKPTISSPNETNAQDKVSDADKAHEIQQDKQNSCLVKTQEQASNETIAISQDMQAPSNSVANEEPIVESSLGSDSDSLDAVVATDAAMDAADAATVLQNETKTLADVEPKPEEYLELEAELDSDGPAASSDEDDTETRNLSGGHFKKPFEIKSI